MNYGITFHLGARFRRRNFCYTIFVETGLQRLSFEQFECSGPVSLSFGPQKHDRPVVPLIEAARQFMEVGHENNFDLFVQ